MASLGFLGGQLVAWRELAASGYLVAGNPADSFFYLLTGLHGLHVLGGLVALARTASRRLGLRRGRSSLRLRVELCTIYWHFLLLSGWASSRCSPAGRRELVDICRQLLT